MKKNKKTREGIIFSTNPNFEYQYKNQEIETIPTYEQKLKVYIDKHRAGKTVVIIKNFIGTTKDLKALGKTLKVKCGVGGSVKNKEIIIQGNVRQKVMEILDQEGYNYTRIGG